MKPEYRSGSATVQASKEKELRRLTSQNFVVSNGMSGRPRKKGTTVAPSWLKSCRERPYRRTTGQHISLHTDDVEEKDIAYLHFYFGALCDLGDVLCLVHPRTRVIVIRHEEHASTTILDSTE